MPTDPLTGRAKWTREELDTLAKVSANFGDPAEVLQNAPKLQVAGYSVRHVREQIKYQDAKKSALRPQPESPAATMNARRSLKESRAAATAAKGARHDRKNQEGLEAFLNRYPDYSSDLPQVAHSLQHKFATPSYSSEPWTVGSVQQVPEEEEEEEEREFEEPTTPPVRPKPRGPISASYQSPSTSAGWGSVLAPPSLQDSFPNAVKVSLENRMPWIDCYPTDDIVRIVLYPIPAGAAAVATKRPERGKVYVSVTWKSQLPPATAVTKADLVRVRRSEPVVFHFEFDFSDLHIDFGAPVTPTSGKDWMCFELPRSR